MTLEHSCRMDSLGKYLLLMCITLKYFKCLGWRHIKSEVYYDAIFIQNVTQASIIKSVYTLRSRGFCAMRCTRDNSESYCFDQDNLKCYCNKYRDDSVVIENSVTTYSYGIISHQVRVS